MSNAKSVFFSAMQACTFICIASQVSDKVTYVLRYFFQAIACKQTAYK